MVEIDMYLFCIQIELNGVLLYLNFRLSNFRLSDGYFTRTDV